MASVLFIDGALPSFPHPDRGWRVLRILRALVEAGHRVVYLLLRGERYEIYRPVFEEAGVEFYVEEGARIYRQVPVNCRVVGLDQLVREIPFHLAFIHFAANAAACIPVIRRHSPRTRIAVDTVDLAHIRLWREALVTGRREAVVEAYRHWEIETAVFRQADAVIAVTPLEAEMISRLAPGVKTVVIPIIADAWPQVNPFSSRQGLLYVGNFFHPPNADAVFYLVDHIWPHLQKDLPGVELYIVGHNPPREIRDRAADGIKVTGYVPSLAPYFGQCRLMVAPIRYGAGIKTKIVEAMAAGLPVVTTSMGAEGMGLQPGENVLLADDPVSFSRAVAALYQNQSLWDRLSQKGREHVRRHYSFPVVAPAIYSLLSS
ncbi:glycosyl transferase group 1 [Desulfofundulus kuznetsovii DSM 6115]|uniref:Glycosyl transferase group 1 n=1 Tax=Desulfofundulus kuznetsovii (strain DSM 6115 / VKM B-1805 / 17) TaxID=760568 RepID=A0AAU8PX10_DESK7|nr:glycosyl transferase group 1 [Desulfofundulus kuznetsovii DSM 6115]